MSKEKLLEVKHLKKYFATPAGQLHAVDDVTFDIAKGETLGVVLAERFCVYMSQHREKCCFTEKIF